MLDNQFVFESEPIVSNEFRRRRSRRRANFRDDLMPWADREVSEDEYDFEGGAIATRCVPYERGEVQKSNTESGHLPSDFFVGPAGYNVIADFAVGSPIVKRSVATNANLKAWLNQTLQKAAQDPTLKLKLSGYTDCVNKENRNAGLRVARAKQVVKLLEKIGGRDPRWNTLKNRISDGAAPLDQYIVDNANPANRATNRGVSLELTQTMSFDPEQVCDNRIKTVTVWVNAFIPRDIPGRTKPVPSLLVRADPTMAGKTMFETNLGCGLTDQRSFSADPAASVRMQSLAKIDLVNPRIIDQKQRIERSIAVHCQFGQILCNKRSPVPPGMKYTWVGVGRDNEIMVKVDGSQGPGCPSSAALKKAGQILLDMKIDYHGTFFIKRTIKNGKALKNYVDIGFLGKIDMFPAYEFAVQINDAKPIHLGGVLPKPGSSPVTHLGTSQKMHFVTRLWLACKDGKQTAGIAERIIN